MQRMLDRLTALLFFAAAIAVLIAGGWCLSHSIEQAKDQPAPIVVDRVHIRLPGPTPEPLPTPTPIPELDKPAYHPAIPLSPELQETLFAVCEEADVPIPLALGLIEAESCFQVDAVSAEGCYGPCQLNPLYFPEDLSPADNIQQGISYLGRLLERYGDMGAALTAYNCGHDTGYRGYANAVLTAAEWWEEALQ